VQINLVPVTVACVVVWPEDFRNEIAHNELPTVIIHSDDGVLPADAMSRRQAKLIDGVKLIEIMESSHGVPWTRAKEVHNELVKFLS
jgi:non-heme chloroperoxidase